MAVSNQAALNCADFDVSAERGFLPPDDPLESLPGKQYEVWEAVSIELPKLLAAGASPDYIAPPATRMNV
jgi:hypothetical protein